MKLLIVNADDFGLHPAVNRAIIQGYTGGCITSTSIIAAGAAFDDAAALAADQPGLGVGVHLTLVGEKTVADPAQVPSLVAGSGRLPPHYPAFMAKLLLGSISLAEVRLELAAQLTKVQAAGLAITHIDSHQHLHVLPGIRAIAFELAGQFGIKAVRIPAEAPFFTGGFPVTPGRFLGRLGLSILASLTRPLARARRMAAPDHFFGMLAGGNLREEYLLNIIDSLPDGVSEIMTHPGDDDNALGRLYGWQYNWQQELAGLTSPSVRRRLEERGVRLISFAGLTP